MKPSERIHEIAHEFVEQTRKVAGPENFQRHEREYRESALLRAIVQYHDEKEPSGAWRWLSWLRRCTHEHGTIAVTYAPPDPDFVDSIQSLKGPGADWLITKAVHGVTTVLLRCRRCGHTETRQMLGKELTS